MIGAPPLPAGWSGKLWAIAAGLRHAAIVAPEAPLFLLTDADIEHAPGNLGRLVAKALFEGLDLASVMVRLRCESFWEHLLIPPFVFFFQKLYPFRAVNDPRSRTAAAAGGCTLVRRLALEEAGGIEAIRDRLIDDVALARAIKWRAEERAAPIWLGLSETTRSLRSYAALGEVWALVTRTADTQLGHSLLGLIGTVVGMAMTYVLPPFALLTAPLQGDAAAAGLALVAFLGHGDRVFGRHYGYTASR